MEPRLSEVARLLGEGIEPVEPDDALVSALAAAAEASTLSPGSSSIGRRARAPRRTLRLAAVAASVMLTTMGAAYAVEQLRPTPSHPGDGPLAPASTANVRDEPDGAPAAGRDDGAAARRRHEVPATSSEADDHGRHLHGANEDAHSTHESHGGRETPGSDDADGPSGGDGPSDDGQDSGDDHGDGGDHGDGQDDNGQGSGQGSSGDDSGQDSGDDSGDDSGQDSGDDSGQDSGDQSEDGGDHGDDQGSDSSGSGSSGSGSDVEDGQAPGLTR